MPRINPAKAWCFTLNNYTENEVGALVQRFSDLSDKYYFIVGKEVGAQGTHHLQGYIEKKTGRFRPLPCFEVLRDGVNAMHFERAKGSRTQNYKYCSKEFDFVTNINKPVMTYNKAKDIWKKTAGISTDEVDPATINEAAMHIQLIEEYDLYNDEQQKVFMAQYDKMMADRYPPTTQHDVNTWLES